MRDWGLCPRYCSGVGRRNYQTIVNAKVKFGKMTGRNQDAIRKTTAGFLKLIFPHRAPKTLFDEEFTSCFNISLECRQRIIDQLAILAPGEFRNISLKDEIEHNFSQNYRSSNQRRGTLRE